MRRPQLPSLIVRAALRMRTVPRPSEALRYSTGSRFPPAALGPDHPQGRLTDRSGSSYEITTPHLL